MRAWTRSAPAKLSPRTPWRSSNTEALFQVPDTIPGNADLGLPLIFQANDHSAVHVRIDLVDEGDVHHRAAMHAYESARIEPLLELRERVVDDVFAAAERDKRQFVLRHDMADTGNVEDDGPIR